jgi:large subunit ribosomal protein L32
MTPLPKRRDSTMRQGKRRATHILKLANLAPCANCKQPTRLHNACSHCGYYRGKKVTK